MADIITGDLSTTSNTTEQTVDPITTSEETPVVVADEQEDVDLAEVVVQEATASTLELTLEDRLNAALALVWAELGIRSADPDPGFVDLLTNVFGVGTEAAQALADRLAAGDTLGLKYEIETAAEMESAAGAYALVGDDGVATIYINGDWLATATDAEIRMVLLEEIAHSFDTVLNGDIDTAGDEGELFANLFSGVEPSEEQRAAILAEDDSATLTIDGVQVGVEQDNSTGLSGNPTFSVNATTGNLTVSGTLTYVGTANSNTPVIKISWPGGPGGGVTATVSGFTDLASPNTGTATFTADLGNVFTSGTTYTFTFDIQAAGTDPTRTYTYNFTPPLGTGQHCPQRPNCQ